MDCFLIFLYEILKSKIFFFYFFKLTYINSCDSRYGSLTGSNLKLDLISMIR